MPDGRAIRMGVRALRYLRLLGAQGAVSGGALSDLLDQTVTPVVVIVNHKFESSPRMPLSRAKKLLYPVVSRQHICHPVLRKNVPATAAPHARTHARACAPLLGRLPLPWTGWPTPRLPTTGDQVSRPFRWTFDNPVHACAAPVRER